MDQDKRETVETAKTFTQDELNEILARTVEKEKKTLASELNTTKSKISEYESKIAELEQNLISKSSVDELKTSFSTKEKNWQQREKVLLAEKEALINKWNTEKVQATYATLTNGKIDFSQDLVLEHLINHSKINDEGQVVYIDKENTEHLAEKAVEQFVTKRPELQKAGPTGVGTRPGKPPVKINKPTGQMTSAELFRAAEEQGIK